MSSRAKRSLASGVLLLYMFAFIGVAAWVLPMIAEAKWAMGLLTLAAGLTWAVPLIPFLRWASRPDPDDEV